MKKNPKEGVVNNIGAVLDNQSQSRLASEAPDSSRLKYPDLQ